MVQLGIAHGNMSSMCWVSQGMLEGRDKDLLTGEGFALVVIPRKGNQGLYENPKADFIQVGLYLLLPCLTHRHLHGTIRGGSSMDTWGMSAGMLSSGGRAAPGASPHSCHSCCQAQAPAGPSSSSCSHRFGSQFGSEETHFNLALLQAMHLSCSFSQFCLQEAARLNQGSPGHLW